MMKLWGNSWIMCFQHFHYPIPLISYHFFAILSWTAMTLSCQWKPVPTQHHCCWNHHSNNDCIVTICLWLHTCHFDLDILPLHMEIVAPSTSPAEVLSAPVARVWLQIDAETAAATTITRGRSDKCINNMQDDKDDYLDDDDWGRGMGLVRQPQK